MITASQKISFLILTSIIICFIAVIVVRANNSLQHPSTHALWPKHVPGTTNTTQTYTPHIEIFIARNPNSKKPAILVIPGGGYYNLTANYEGSSIAHMLNKIGVSAFVLHYRRAPRYEYPAALDDAQKALKHIRYNAQKYNINENNIGVIGFSAGGHLASTIATHYATSAYMSAPAYLHQKEDLISSKPDFAILGYPVITLQKPYTHDITAKHFLGTHDNKDMRKRYSNHLSVTKETPPMFIFHTQEDKGVPVQNSAMMYHKLIRNNIPVEFHAYEKGAHGSGLADGKNGAPDIAHLTTWPLLLRHWFYQRGILAN